MDMVVDMLGAEAVIPLTARAVAELKAGIIRIRFAADSAFMSIELRLLLPADALGLPSEIDRTL